jgi:hypothetical protein
MSVESKLKTLDIKKTIGEITLSDGETKLPVPKLSMLKIIQIVKFLGVDGTKIYSNARDVLIDDSYDMIEKYGVIIEELQEEQLIRIISILLDVDNQTALGLDINEVLEVLLVHAEHTDLEKTFTLVRQLMKKMFNKELPDFKELMDRVFPEVPVVEAPVEQTEEEPVEKAKEEATA